MAIKYTGDVVYYIDDDGNLRSAQSFVDEKGRTGTKEEIVEESVDTPTE